MIDELTCGSVVGGRWLVGGRWFYNTSASDYVLLATHIYYTILYCTMLYYTILVYYTILYYTILNISYFNKFTFENKKAGSSQLTSSYIAMHLG